MKFGGDSLATPKNQDIVKNIVSSSKEKIILVCSAMGRDGFPYSTASLLKLIDEKNISNKELDRLISVGEIISSIRLSSVLNSNKIKSYALSINEMGIKCDNSYTDGNVVSLDNKKINELIKKYKVIIVPGFIGLSNENEIITLGRGNSDLTSVLMAKLFSLDKVYLYKNVDGVFHTAPNVYRQFKIFNFISYDEMLALVDIGFGIVSKKAIIEAKKNKIILQINNYQTNIVGTIISSKASGDLILGFNIIDKLVKVATFNVQKVRDIITNSLEKKHIFVKNEMIKNSEYSFEISKSMVNLVKNILLDVINEYNK